MEIEKKEVLNWFWNFRPDLAVDENFVEDLHRQYVQSNKNLSLDESSFFGYVVFNYRSEIINFIYKALEEKKVTIEHLLGVRYAHKVIQESIELYNKKFRNNS